MINNTYFIFFIDSVVEVEYYLSGKNVVFVRTCVIQSASFHIKIGKSLPKKSLCRSLESFPKQAYPKYN